jgi:hypothetical protein
MPLVRPARLRSIGRIRPTIRRELAKYNPGPGVVDQIVATLSL